MLFTKRAVLSGLAVFLICWTTGARAADQYRFVAEYIRELAEEEAHRSRAEVQNATQNTQGKISNCVADSESFQLEIGTAISALSRFTLEGPFDQARNALVRLHQQRAYIWKQVGESCSLVLAGPAPGVDVGRLASEMARLRGQQEFLDKQLFPVTAIVFGSLIDSRADSRGHANHLIITRAQRDELVRDLRRGFGAKLDQNDARYGVQAASVLEDYLTKKGFLCADEPWG